MFHPGSLNDALDALGIALADRGLAYEAVVAGGGCLLLHGWLRRPTKDLDIIAFVMDGDYVLAEPFPVPLRTAVHDVADLLSLGRDWFNPGPTSQLRTGLPDGFRERAAAAHWVKGQDASPEFSAIVDEVVQAFGGGDDIA